MVGESEMAMGSFAMANGAAGEILLFKARSGKILRGIMRAIANGKGYRMPSTIDDPTSLTEIADTAKADGYPKVDGIGYKV